ncbi:MAG: class II aldolase/adducin family protein [Spirochaetales bacterium]|nr:class II aldolase/adducin family protein [Spirochaetales bacterium]
MSKNILSQKNPIASIKNEDKILITSESFASDKSLAEINLISGEILSGVPNKEYKLHLEIYKKRPKESAILHSALEATTTCSIVGKTVYPMLDDMAQIVGPSAKTACIKTKTHQGCVKNILKKMKGRQAALISENGAICCASNLDDASVVAIVLEKGCKTAVESFAIGGGKKINDLECRLMHFVYTLKYSKQNEKNR